MQETESSPWPGNIPLTTHPPPTAMFESTDHMRIKTERSRCRTRRIASLVALLWVASAGCAARGNSVDSAGRQMAYVSVEGNARVHVFEVDAEDGGWREVQVVEQSAGAAHYSTSAPMAVSPDRRFLHVGMRGLGAVATYAIGADGRLSLLGTASIGGSAPFITRDRTGRWLLAAYYADGKVAVHRVAADGTIVEGPVQERVTAPNAHSILLDPQNRFAFVPHTAGNAVHQFRFDAGTGMLSPNQPATVDPPAGTAPRHIRAHPTLPIVYVINEAGSSIMAYRFDAASGTLAHLQTVPTLPPDYSGNNSTADLQVTPNGRFLYGSNRGHDSLAGYAIDRGTGRLTAIGIFPTERTPRSFAIDPTGRFLYAAGQNSGRVAAYRIEASSGRLTPMATYDIAPLPTWIEIVSLN